ncbi:MAG: S24 family peptidase [Sphingomonadaceae bacterium]|nr:S24 family peptidase [Sphingomonadaceae bacterium]
MKPEWNFSADAKDRLRRAVERWGNQARAAAASGLNKQTVQRLLDPKVESDVSLTRVAALARTVGVSLDWVIHGRQEPASGPGEEFGLVALYDIELAAGHGRQPMTEEPTGFFAFRQDYLNRFADRSALAVLTVRGDSMTPELQDGDNVLIDRAQSRVGDGIYAVRLSDQLLIKRVQQMVGGICLRSDNRAYEPLYLANGDPEWAILGRAVWVGRKLATD